MPTVARRKFAKPPVKVACLACRTSRTRCDGKETCSSCASKGKKCLYTPSKRGGPRKKKSPTSQPQEALHSNVTASASVAAVSDPQNGPWEPMLVPNQEFDNSNMFNQLDSLGMPAAGLKQLDFPVDVHSMFQDMLVPSQSHAPQVEPGVQDVPIVKKPNVRVYDSEEDILNAYYVFIHSYFPLLPPPTSALTADRPIDYAGETSDSASRLNVPYEPSSPLSLAISAILALVPHPRDPSPSSGDAVLLRRSTAEDFAQAAIGNIEADSELVESATQPSQALQNPNPSILRKPLHSGTPLELEGILALLILSIYEYAQRGNLKKMRSRAGQAYVMAMDMSLHSLGAQDDEFSEARRRAWWMTFYCVCQGSIVSTTPPTILVNDSRFVTPYPRFAADPEGWYILLQAQEALVCATQYILELNRCLKSRSNMPYIYDRMQKLNGWAESILQKADSFPPTIPIAGSSYSSEAMTAQSMRCISRIKLCSARIKTHRFRAFSDIPIFIQRHCDLTAAGGIEQDDKSTSHEPHGQDISKLSCSCSNFEMLPSTTKTEYMPSPSSSTSSTSMTPLPSFFGPGFPFSVEYSATVCLSSALMAAEMFHSLPFPEPFYQDGFLPQQPPGSEPKPSLVLPRTMPSFACCAMQSSYAMLMLYYRARVSQPQDPERAREWILKGPIRKIQHGLEQIIDSVRNYSIAFEALDGMRDEIEGAFETAFRHQN